MANKITQYDKALIHIGLNLLYEKAYRKHLSKGEKEYLEMSCDESAKKIVCKRIEQLETNELLK